MSQDSNTSKDTNTSQGSDLYKDTSLPQGSNLSQGQNSLTSTYKQNNSTGSIIKTVDSNMSFACLTMMILVSGVSTVLLYKYKKYSR